MAVTRRIISDTKLDSYVPSAILCLKCKSEIDITTGHHGKVYPIAGGQPAFTSRDITEPVFKVYNGKVHTIPVIETRWFVKTQTGWVCPSCYVTLYNVTWYDKDNHLCRAFKTVSIDIDKREGQLQSQRETTGDQASPITKGLYAPHAKGTLDSAIINEIDRGSDHAISQSAVEKADRKLAGFDRPEPRNHNLKPKRIVARNGNWKVKPDDYFAEPERELTKPKGKGK